MAKTPVKVARGLSLYGGRILSGTMDQKTFRKTLEIEPPTFRSSLRAFAAGNEGKPGLRFFELSDGKPRFGPGAGLVVGVSLGTTTLRAALFDANGTRHHEYESPSEPGQLDLRPEAVIARIRRATGEVLRPALDDESLLVDGELKLRAVAVAWPAPVNRQKHLVGHVLSNSAWHGPTSLTKRVATGLKIEPKRSHALNDSHAAAIAVAFDHTRKFEHADQKFPELTMVLRVAGGISGATIVIEPPEDGGDKIGEISGFPDSVLLGGVDLQAGEVGHVTMPESTISELNRHRGKLGKLQAVRCSCTRQDDPVPPHLEAFASRTALTHRISPNESTEAVMARVLAEPDAAPHRRALENVGVMVADSLLAAVAMLNPARIVLTGALVTPSLVDGFGQRLHDKHKIIAETRIDSLAGKDNDFIRAKGAALAVIREQIYRRFSNIDTTADKARERLEEENLSLAKLPWEK
jgi:predicted NBD/HSP70 family sugar kinase